MGEKTTLCIKSLVTLVLAVLVQSLPARAQSPDSIADRQHAVEAGLLPPVVVEGESDPGYSIYEGMRRDSVPGVSIAVINDGDVEWAKGYGVTQAGREDSVVASTRFQAASISKPVAATAMLRLVEDGQYALDENVNHWLRSWRVPENEHTAQRPVTLRRLLSHTAGLTVHGFPGYPSDEPVPTAVEVLEGAGNTDPVRTDTLPGAIFRYSGGGYTVAQVLTQDVTGNPFDAVMEREVLDPLGMYRSTYQQPLPKHLAHSAAVAHRDDGTPLEGQWHTYPEQAAAGLWTTPLDLARFALGIRAAYRGEPGAILQQPTAQDMLSRHMEDRGLGLEVSGRGDRLRFSHGGANAGYRAYLVLYPATGDGVAVMTNSDGGGSLRLDVVRAVASVYGWPDYQPETRSVIEVDSSTIADYVGTYEFSPDEVITITQEGNQLFADVANLSKFPLLANTKTKFFRNGDKAWVIFERDANGRVSHLTLDLGDTELKAIRQKP